MDVTHIAADRLGPNGELYRACDGKPLEPLPPSYVNDNNPESVPLVLCEACKREARKVGTR